MHGKLGAALQEAKETVKALESTNDKRDMVSEHMEKATMKLNAMHEALIRVKANSAPISTCWPNATNHIFNIMTTRLPTYDDTRTLHAVTSCMCTISHRFQPCGEELPWMDECPIPLPTGWLPTALHQFCDTSVVWANWRFPVHTSAGVAWDDISAAVRVGFIPLDAMTRLKREWEYLQIYGGKCVSTDNECFWLLRHELEIHVQLSNKRICDSYQFNHLSSPEVSKAGIEKLESEPTALVNDVMEHISRVDAMFNSRRQPSQVTVEPMV